MRHANRRSEIGWADSGVTTATVTSPGELETALLDALTALPRPRTHTGRPRPEQA
jgi:hypothetical protein